MTTEVAKVETNKVETTEVETVKGAVRKIPDIVKVKNVSKTEFKCPANVNNGNTIEPGATGIVTRAMYLQHSAGKNPIFVRIK